MKPNITAEEVFERISSVDLNDRLYRREFNVTKLAELLADILNKQNENN